MRDEILAGHVRDAVSRWVEAHTGDARLGAEIRFLTPASMLARYAKAAQRRKREDPRQKDVRVLMRQLKELEAENRRARRNVARGT